MGRDRYKRKIEVGCKFSGDTGVFVFFYALKVMLYERWSLLIVNLLSNIRAKDAGGLFVWHQNLRRTRLEGSILLVESA